MGKSRARQAPRRHGRDTSLLQRGRPAVKRRQHVVVGQNGGLLTVKVAEGKAAKVAKTKERVPFARDGNGSGSDNILLVGEGDFSFARALVDKYTPASVVATCFDSEADLLSKYPGVDARIAQIERGSRVAADDDDSFEGFSPTTTDHDHDPDSDSGSNEQEQTVDRSKVSILYGIDATKLSTVHKKALLRPAGPFSKIVFNFPHVGGLSTDVNRQVRANQQLLVGFFSSAKSLLQANSGLRRRNQQQTQHDDDEAGESDQDNSKAQIIVTLFEGEPYTLWNIRDLARHCGLQVVESFAFPWTAYPGYRHARTAGDIVTGKDRTSEGKRRGAWRGEERAARSYVFEVKQDGGAGSQHAASGKKKRRRGSESSSDDD